MEGDIHACFSQVQETKASCVWTAMRVGRWDALFPVPLVHEVVLLLGTHSSGPGRPQRPFQTLWAQKPPTTLAKLMWLWLRALQGRRQVGETGREKGVTNLQLQKGVTRGGADGQATQEESRQCGCFWEGTPFVQAEPKDRTQGRRGRRPFSIHQHNKAK